MANLQSPIDDGLEDIFGDGDTNEGVALNQESAPSFSAEPEPQTTPQVSAPPVQEFQLPNLDDFDIGGEEEPAVEPAMVSTPQIEDMEIGTLPNDLQQAVAEEVSEPTVQATRASRKGVGRGLKVVVVALLSLGVVAGVVIGAYMLLFSNNAEENTDDQSAQIVEDITPVQDTVTNDANDIIEGTTENDVVADADSDGDGLLDSEEAEYGTSPQKIDTDSDGISDRTEIRVYKTDPLDEDTDGDGFTDGAEVRNFYNPNGDGKLPGIQEAIDQLSETE